MILFNWTKNYFFSSSNHHFIHEMTRNSGLTEITFTINGYFFSLVIYFIFLCLFYSLLPKQRKKCVLHTKTILPRSSSMLRKMSCAPIHNPFVDNMVSISLYTVFISIVVLCSPHRTRIKYWSVRIFSFSRRNRSVKQSVIVLI